MTRPTVYLVRMTLFLAATAAVVVLLRTRLLEAFEANVVINTMIFAVLGFGILLIFTQVAKLGSSVGWLENFQRNTGSIAVGEHHPSLLIPLVSAAHTSTDRRGRMTLSVTSTRAILDSVGGRLDDMRDISRYFTGLLIFLGLLGTFWGLLETVSAVGTVLQGLTPQGDSFDPIFEQLKQGLEQPLSGMGVAFSASMFGLSGSLVLGFLDLQMGQAQNRFLGDLEEWLGGHVQVSAGGFVLDGDAPIPPYIRTLLEQIADSLDHMQRGLARIDDSRQSTGIVTQNLADKLGALAEILHQNSGKGHETVAHLDPTSRGYLRNIEAHISNLIEEQRDIQLQVSRELRDELRLLGRTLSLALGDQGSR